MCTKEPLPLLLVGNFRSVDKTDTDYKKMVALPHSNHIVNSQRQHVDQLGNAVVNSYFNQYI